MSFKELYDAINPKVKPKPKTQFIQSSEIFQTRTLESRYLLSKYEKLSKNDNIELSMNRNILRRGRAPILSHKKRQNKLYKKYNSYFYKNKLNIKTKRKIKTYNTHFNTNKK